MSLMDVTAAKGTPTLTRGRALSAQESLAVGGRLADLARLVERRRGETLAGMGLTPNSWRLLTELDADGVNVPRTAGEWGARADLSPSSMSAAADLLHRNGWLRRWRDPANRRSVLVSMTSEGATAAEGARGALAESGAAFAAVVDADRLRELDRLISQLLTAWDGAGPQ